MINQVLDRIDQLRHLLHLVEDDPRPVSVRPAGQGLDLRAEQLGRPLITLSHFRPEKIQQ